MATVVCGNCKHENDYGALACSACGFVFAMPATHPLIPGTLDERDNDLGTNIFLPGTMSLQLYVNGYKDPIKVSFGKFRILTLGRAMPDNAVEIDLTAYGARNAGVSRSHAVLSYMNDTLYIADLGSSNGTYVNGAKLENGKPTAIRAFDEISLGHLAFKVYFA